MNPGDETSQPAEAFSALEVERLLEKVANAEVDIANASKEAKEMVTGGNERFDFRNLTVLNPTEMRKLRLQQDEFVRSLASRLSQHLRLEFSLKLSRLQTVAYQKLAESWANPTNLSLFKVEPLRGICVLEIPPRMGLGMVDRLMGGSGQPPEIAQEMSEIERALLDQVVQLVLSEWCQQWVKFKELKPAVLGYESNGHFVQGIASEATMLVIGMEAKMGECVEEIKIGFPYQALEPLIRQLSPPLEAPKSAVAQPAVACKWNPCLDEVCIPVSAEWQGFELSAREVLKLKVGDVLQIDPQIAEQVKVKLAELPKFDGRLGMVGGKWAVELTRAAKR